MRVTEVTTQQYYSGILAPDLATVKRVLYAYAKGVSSVSNGTRANQPSMVLMGLDMIQPSGHTFVDHLFEEIEQRLSEHTSFNRSYDYDGAGRFLKTSVTVDKVDEGFIVAFFAAYVGNKAEVDIAEHLGLPRSLRWSKVSVVLDAAKGDQFVIDFQPIMDVLSASSFAGPGASEVASLIAAGYKEDYSTLVMHGGIVPLFDNGTFNGSIRINDTTVGRYYDHPYVADESIVTGALRPVWDAPQFEQPELAFYVDANAHDDKGILDLAVQHQVVALTNELSARLSTLVEEVVSADA